MHVKPTKKCKAYDEFGTQQEELIWNNACDLWELWHNQEIEKINRELEKILKKINTTQKALTDLEKGE